ncbi:hypothetical protein C8Q70DRAFT_997969 [Cubamyces menziesii]|nr:hypothetical protein C8Q70DRAFT_997969 [Cubamyces menziesii]
METTPAVQVDAATGPLSDNADIASTDANESNASAPPQTQQGEIGAGTQSERPARVREVSPRSLSEMVNGQELIYGILCGVEAHGAIYERTGELHGDINPNAILFLDTTEPDGTPVTEGALIYWVPPINFQTLRDVGRRDPPVPPPQRYQYSGFMPRWDHGWHV